MRYSAATMQTEGRLDQAHLRRADGRRSPRTLADIDFKFRKSLTSLEFKLAKNTTDTAMLQHEMRVLRQDMRDRHESLRHEMAARCGGRPPSAPAYSPGAPTYPVSLAASMREVREEARVAKWLAVALFAVGAACSVVVYAILIQLWIS